jgi:predicted nucleic acid-binding protein
VPLPPRLFCDTSFFYATVAPEDAKYDQAGALLSEIIATRVQLFVTWDIISETVTLLRYRVHFPAALAFLIDVRPALAIVDYGDSVRVEAERVFRARARERRLSFCDAISFVVVTTVLDHMPCVAFDDDFRALGLTVIS